MKESDKSKFYKEESSIHYEYGKRIGKKYSIQFKLLDIFSRLINRKKINSKKIADQIKDLELYCPTFLEELSGLSSSLNIDLERLIFIQNSFFY